ncbi:helix-turn-helix transcriptional regulator [Lysinibacillus pakistanensis]|uniref:helix-turn-helix domain-containing protein n=1 Tax=Lysinibacillus pakistanensis TaxID=759811 RepID=UPI003D2D80CA
MGIRAKSKLKSILDEKGISIRKCAEMSGVNFETVRKMYNDESKQYQRDTLGALCKALGCEINDLLEIIEEPNEK